MSRLVIASARDQVERLACRALSLARGVGGDEHAGELSYSCRVASDPIPPLDYEAESSDYRVELSLIDGVYARGRVTHYSAGRYRYRVTRREGVEP